MFGITQTHVLYGFGALLLLALVDAGIFLAHGRAYATIMKDYTILAAMALVCVFFGVMVHAHNEDKKQD